MNNGVIKNKVNRVGFWGQILAEVTGGVDQIGRPESAGECSVLAPERAG